MSEISCRLLFDLGAIVEKLLYFYMSFLFLIFFSFSIN